MIDARANTHRTETGLFEAVLRIRDRDDAGRIAAGWDVLLGVWPSQAEAFAAGLPLADAINSPTFSAAALNLAA